MTRTASVVRDFGEEKRVHDDHYDDDFQSEFGFVLLGLALEDLFGLPRSQLPQREARPAASNETKAPTVLKGRVLDLDGTPIALAKVSHSGFFREDTAVETGPTGEFVLSVEERRQTVIHVNVEASGFATRCFILRIQDEDRIEDSRDQANSVSVDPSGAARQPLRLSRGVTVTGRVLAKGKPVVGVSIGLTSVYSTLDPEGFFHPKALEASTDAQGYYRFPHSLPETEFWVFAKLGSLANGGAMTPVRVQTTGEGSAIDVGELHVETGRRLAGRLVCSDGKKVPEDLLLLASCTNAQSNLEQRPGPAGRFEFKGLPAGPVWLEVTYQTTSDRPRYGFSAKNLCRNPENVTYLEGQLDHDIADLTILLEPGAEPKHDSDPDPALVADFNDAKAGPITGVPPRP